MEKPTWLLFITLIILCWNGGPGSPVSVSSQTTDSLQVISIKGRVLGPGGKPIQEYDHLEPGREYRLLPETEVQLSTLDGKNIYEAVGPGVVFIDSSGSFLLNGKALKPNLQENLHQGVSAARIPAHELAGLTLRRLLVVPDQEKRSSIHEVDGYAYLGENTTLGQARKAALATAKRQALEMARTRIESNTLVREGKLEYDLIQSGTEGYVSVLEQKDHGLKDNRYHVWIRAEVEYGLKPTGKQPNSSQILSPDAPLTVLVWTPQKRYRKGQKVVVHIIGNRDFYARIVNVDSEGTITQILPNDYRSKRHFEGGRLYTVPGKGDRFAFKVMDTYGEEEIVVYASEVPLGRVKTEPAGAGLRGYRGTRGQLARETRSIRVRPVGGSSDSGAGFYEATWKFTTSR
ncbi:MAG: DUF4384 domain-containing protein [Desulfobacteraceae bacterium]|nr:DUF4384 domain-containing protein [Desulfobacteraceae bacterium]